MSSNDWPMPTTSLPPGFGADDGRPGAAGPQQRVSAADRCGSECTTLEQLAATQPVNVLLHAELPPDLPYRDTIPAAARKPIREHRLQTSPTTLGLTSCVRNTRFKSIHSQMSSLGQTRRRDRARRSVHQPAAADVQRRAGDVAGVLGGEEDDRGSDLVGGSPSGRAGPGRRALRGRRRARPSRQHRRVDRGPVRRR